MSRDNRVAWPECFEGGAEAFESVLKLYRSNRLPAPIESFMLETPIKRMLRGIHQKTNLGVAWKLMREAIMERLRYRWYSVRFWFGYDPLEGKERESK